MSAEELLDLCRRELAGTEDAIRRHRYLDALEQGTVPETSLRTFAGEQYWILTSDRRSFSHLASRFPEPPAGDFFLGLAQGEGEALRRLSAFADGLGLTEDALRRHRPDPRSHAYTAYVAWLALNGSRLDLALAFLVNLVAWGANCGRMADALRDRHDIAFFELFAAPPPGFEQRAFAVAEQGVAAGDSPERARAAAGLLQAYELSFWDGLADALQL